MIYLKSPSQIKAIEYVNKLSAEFLCICKDYLKDGVVTFKLEELAIKFCEVNKVRATFFNYGGFPYHLTVSINDEIIHGFPSNRIIKNGDVVSIDFSIEKNGYISDTAFTKSIDISSKKSKKLVKVTKDSLYCGIAQVKAGNRINDISTAIENHVINNGFNVIKKFTGHGVGLKLHEQPKILNYTNANINWKLRTGMVIAIEPIVTMGGNKFIRTKNNWTIITKDNKNTAHFEHSVAVLQNGYKILSQL